MYRGKFHIFTPKLISTPLPQNIPYTVTKNFLTSYREDELQVPIEGPTAS